MQNLNRICFALCVACIVAASLTAFAMIWLPQANSDTAWKALTSILVLFLASSAAAGVGRILTHTDKDQ